MNAVFRTAVAAALLAIGFTASAPAQTPDSAAQIKALEQRLEQLENEARDIRAALESIKSSSENALAEAPAEDLTAIEPVAPPETTAAAPAPAELGSEPVQNAPAAAPSKIFNPDISIIGNLVGHAGDENPFDERDTMQLEEAEMSVEAFVDPYAKAKFFIGYSDEGVEIEEGYAQFVALPWDLTAKAGKMKAGFGKFNQMHFHTWPWVDAPLVFRQYFGDGLADSGISVSKLVPAGNSVVEATAEVYRGEVEDVFTRADRNDLFYLGHLKFYRDLTDNANIEVGGSWAQGSLSEVGGTNSFTGADVTFRWKPLERSIYRAFIARTEIVRNDRDDVDDAALGMYASADYQFARRWQTGLRLDSVERPDDPSLTDRGGALTLTFLPSEFSRLRGEFRRTSYDGDIDANEFLLQFQFAIGAHGAHSF